MVYQRLIPSLLLRHGRLVKGRRFRSHRDAGQPAATTRAHNYQSADELIVSDIDASQHNRTPDFTQLAAIAENCFMPLTVFGGIRSIEIADECFGIGADKIGMTTAAIDNPQLIDQFAHKYGAQSVVVGIDIWSDQSNTSYLFDHRTGNVLLEPKPFEFAVECIARGCGELRLMAVNREGILCGFDLPLLNQFREKVDVPLILEGGAGSLKDIEAAYAAGADGIAIGAMLVFSDANLVKIKQHLLTQGCNVRPT